MHTHIFHINIWAPEDIVDKVQALCQDALQETTKGAELKTYIEEKLPELPQRTYMSISSFASFILHPSSFNRNYSIWNQMRYIRRNDPFKQLIVKIIIKAKYKNLETLTDITAYNTAKMIKSKGEVDQLQIPNELKKLVKEFIPAITAL